MDISGRGVSIAQLYVAADGTQCIGRNASSLNSAVYDCMYTHFLLCPLFLLQE